MRSGSRPGAATSAERRGNRSRGAALVEFALIAPLLFALLFAIFTGGFALARQNSMSNATREGARLGATIPAGSTWATSVRDRIINVAGGDLNTTQVCVRLRTKTGATTSTVVHESLGTGCQSAGEPAMPSGLAIGDCYVTAWSRTTVNFEAVFFSRDVTLSAPTVARYERGRGATCVP